MIEALSDSFALIGRHMRHLTRVPEKLLAVTLLPIAFVFIFGTLFGSSMSVPDGDYQQYIMAGIFAQLMLSSLDTTSVGIAFDLKNGLVDRFRSLPISQAAVLVGRTVSDLSLIGLSCAVMAVVGYVIGWRVEGGPLSVLGGFLLLLLLGLAMSWVGALIGLVVRNPEAVNSVATFITMPLTFLSAAFFPIGNLPDWLRIIAEWNPVSAVVTAVRQLWHNPTGIGADPALPLQNPVPFAIILSVVALLLFAPLAGRAYRRASAR